MSSTSLKAGATSGRAASNGSAPGRGRLPAASRDRRPALAALAALLILVGALGSALVAFRSGSRVDVLVARQDIQMGQVITREDLSTARVAADGGSTIDSAAISNFVGTYARGPIPQGTLLNNQMFLAVSEIVPKGAQEVGVVVDAGRRTTERPEPGDVVSLVFVSGSGGQPVGNLSPGDVVVESARVTEVGSGGSGGGSGATSITVLVRDDDAGTVADLASGNSLAVTVLPSSTEPLVDLATE